MRSVPHGDARESVAVQRWKGQGAEEKRQDGLVFGECVRGRRWRTRSKRGGPTWNHGGERRESEGGREEDGQLGGQSPEA